MEHLFRHRVPHMLFREQRIDETVIRKLLGWRHSGFSLHNAVRIGAADTDGRRAVAEYVLRSPFSMEKMQYHNVIGDGVAFVNLSETFRATRWASRFAGNCWARW